MSRNHIKKREAYVPLHHSAGELFNAFAQHLESPAIAAPERKILTYGGLRRHIEHVLAILNAQGLGRGDRIAVVLPNGPEMGVTFLSLIAGAVCAPLNPAYQKSEYDFYLSDIKARALIVMAGADSPARAVAQDKKIPIIELRPCGEEAGLFDLEFAGILSPQECMDGFAQPDDVALILHTSGTTSRPKIVPLTQRNLLRSARNVGLSLQLDRSDRCLNVMPLFHIHGLIAALLASVNAGGSVVCTSGYSDEGFLCWIKDFHPTWYTAVPTIHQAVLESAKRDPSGARHSSLRFIRSSSSSLPPTIMGSLENIFDVPVVEAYGMTEAAHQMASNPMPPLKRKPGSVGLPAGPEVAIMDTSDSILSCGETGEIVIRGDNVMKGYENNPEANEKSFSQGWFRTGDQGYLDPEGYLFITGRLKEIINRGGQKISPREIDEVLLTHPSILQVVAFGMPHHRLGEAVAAAVVLHKGSSVGERDLRQYVADRLAPYKVPQQIIFLDSIPKGPTGKLQRIGLSERLSGLLEPEYAPPETETEIAVAAVWREVLGLPRIGRYDNFFARGGDSLLAMKVLSRISRGIGVTMPVVSIFQHTTLKDFSLAVFQRQLPPEKEEELSLLLSRIEDLPEEEAERMLELFGKDRSEA